MGKTKGGFYAVAKGHKVGVFTTWDECQAQVNGFPNARFKKFPTEKEASNFISENMGTSKAVVLKKQVPPPTIAIPQSTRVCSFGISAPNFATTSKPEPFFKSLTPNAPAWKKNFKHQIHSAAAANSAEFKKKLRVSGDRVVSNKTTQHEDGSLSFNSGIDLSNFDIDEDGYVIVYTDGACKANGKYGARAGIGIWFGDDHSLNVSEPVKGRQTNNTAEIQAAEIAVSQAKKAGIDKLCIKTDSQFVINCITMWVNKWKKNGWKLSDGQPVKNKEDLEKLMAIVKGVEIKWSYVKGHAGHRGNEEADRLAVEGSKKQR